MLKSSFLAAILLSVSLSVGATGNHTPEPTPDPVSQTQDQDQGQSQGQHQGQDQSQNQSQDANASSDQHQSQNADASSDQRQGQHQNANNEGVKVNNSTVVNNKQKRQAAAMGAAAGYTTARCMKGRELRLSGPGAGVGFSFSGEHKDCWLDDFADQELARGNETASIRLRCQISYYKQALGEDCEALLKTIPNPVKPRTQAEIDADTAKFKKSVTK